MRFKFIGKYTNGHTSVAVHGVRFVGTDPVFVDDEYLIGRLRTHPEIEVVLGRPPATQSDAPKPRQPRKKAMVE